MASAATPERARVLVIGGGPVGLVVSGLLSRAGISNQVVERRRDTQRAPAAHVIRRRPMEILQGLGVGDEVRRTAPPLALDYVTWCVTFGGVEIGRLDLRPPDPASGQRPPEPWVNCPQNLLEPILLESASARPEARVLRGAECVSLEQSDAGVVARVRDHRGTERVLEAAWAVAADGASSSIRGALGIPMEGPGPFARLAMVHFEADLSPWIRGRSGPLFWILDPESSGCLIVHDPRCSHVFMMPRIAPESAPDAAAERLEERLIAALDVPVAPKILSVDSWSPHVQVAARYREGRVFLVGDAAHRFPPTGGLGMNTGIQEADDLVARLARVERGEAPPSLLDGYEGACRPAALANARDSFENMKRLGEIGRVLGVHGDRKALEQRIASLDGSEREDLARAIEGQRGHFLSEGRLPETPAGG